MSKSKRNQKRVLFANELCIGARLSRARKHRLMPVIKRYRAVSYTSLLLDQRAKRDY